MRVTGLRKGNLQLRTIFFIGLAIFAMVFLSGCTKESEGFLSGKFVKAEDNDIIARDDDNEYEFEGSASLTADNQINNIDIPVNAEIEIEGSFSLNGHSLENNNEIEVEGDLNGSTDSEVFGNCSLKVEGSVQNFPNICVREIEVEGPLRNYTTNCQTLGLEDDLKAIGYTLYYCYDERKGITRVEVNRIERDFKVKFRENCDD